MRPRGRSCHESVDSRSNWVGGAEHLCAVNSGDHQVNRSTRTPLPLQPAGNQSPARWNSSCRSSHLGSYAVICALGTTSVVRRAKKAFRQVDYVVPLALRTRSSTRRKRRPFLAFFDAISSFFYPKTKGKVERHEAVGFKSLTDPPAQHIGGKARRVAFCRRTCSDACPEYWPVLPKVHVNPAAKIAGVLLDSVICCGPVVISLRRTFDLVPGGIHEIAFDLTSTT